MREREGAPGRPASPSPPHPPLPSRLGSGRGGGGAPWTWEDACGKGLCAAGVAAGRGLLTAELSFAGICRAP